VIAASAQGEEPECFTVDGGNCRLQLDKYTARLAALREMCPMRIDLHPMIELG